MEPATAKAVPDKKQTGAFTLRGWLDRLAATDRLSVARPGIGLVHELAAVANRLDGKTATFFPHPGGHPGSVVSGLVSSRAWMAEALGVSQDALVARFQEAAANPLPFREVAGGPAQEVVHRSGIDLLKLLPIPTQTTTRPLHLGRPDDRARPGNRRSERGDPPLPDQRSGSHRHPLAAAPHRPFLPEGGSRR